MIKILYDVHEREWLQFSFTVKFWSIFQVIMMSASELVWKLLWFDDNFLASPTHMLTRVPNATILESVTLKRWFGPEGFRALTEGLGRRIWPPLPSVFCPVRTQLSFPPGWRLSRCHFRSKDKSLPETQTYRCLDLGLLCLQKQISLLYRGPCIISLRYFYCSSTEKTMTKNAPMYIYLALDEICKIDMLSSLHA